MKRTLLAGRGPAGGRTTQPTNYNPFTGNPYAFIPRRLLSGLDLTEYSPASFAPWQLMQILADSHTDVGMALWNVLRLGTADFGYTVQTPAGQDDPDGQALADRIVAGLNRRAGGLEALMGQWMQSWYLQGAVCGELALTDDLRGVLDIYPVNPWTIFFRRDAITQDLVLYQQQLYRPTNAMGQKNAMGQNQGGAPGVAQSAANDTDRTAGYRELNDTLCVYIPCDPMIDDPYGRIPSGTVINEVFFDVAFMADLQKIVHGAAIPRYVVKIIEEILAKSCPQQIKGDPGKYAAWLDRRLEDVRANFNGLDADEAFVGYDSVSIDIVSAKSGANMLNLVGALVKVIELRMIKSLKMLPILMANNEGTTETHGSVQYEIFAQGIRSAQGAITSMFCRFLTVALQVYGRVCMVDGQFRDIKTANRYVDAGSENREIVNAVLKEALGYITHDDASVAVTGSKSVGPPLDGVMTAIVPHMVSAPANQTIRSAPEPKDPQLATDTEDDNAQ